MAAVEVWCAAWRSAASARHEGSSVFSRGDSHERDDVDGSLDELLESLAADGNAGDDGPEESADGAEIGIETAPLVESYWAVSRMPLTSLVFALPLVLAYEGGVLALGRGCGRSSMRPVSASISCFRRSR